MENKIAGFVIGFLFGFYISIFPGRIGNNNPLLWGLGGGILGLLLT